VSKSLLGFFVLRRLGSLVEASNPLHRNEAMAIRRSVQWFKYTPFLCVTDGDSKP
jgi:hypothetical protein